MTSQLCCYCETTVKLAHGSRFMVHGSRFAVLIRLRGNVIGVEFKGQT